MLIPTFIDGFSQFLSIRESNNSLRFFTGIIGGIGLGIIIKAIKWYFIVGIN